MEPDKIQSAKRRGILILLSDRASQLLNLNFASLLRQLPLRHILALIAVQRIEQAHRKGAG